MVDESGTARSEWRRFGALPPAAAIGYATSVIQLYSLGAYIEPVSKAFGWSRALVTTGLTVATAIQAICGIGIGFAVDKFGPRRLGVVGVIFSSAAFALLGTATGGVANWLLLWAILSFASLPVQATVWTSAVASRFDAGRGTALAITLCGASIAQTVFPWLAANLIANFGWRRAFFAEGALWVAVSFPIVFLFFQSAHDTARRTPTRRASAVPALGGSGLKEGIFSSVYVRLLLASIAFAFATASLAVHFVPILTDGGIPKLTAAGIASAIGLASIAGRLCTGFLLDRYRASIVGGIIFLAPVVGSMMLLLLPTGRLEATIAALLIGLTLGAEMDVITYLVTRHFGLKHFGVLFGLLLGAMFVGIGVGPLCAARIFDVYANYRPFLTLSIILMVTGSVLLISLPRPQGLVRVHPA